MNTKPIVLLSAIITLSGVASCGAPSDGKEELMSNSAVNNISTETFKLSKGSGYVNVFTSRGATKCIYEPSRYGYNLNCNWSSLRTVDENGKPITQRRNAKALNLTEGWLEVDNTQVWCLDSGGSKDCDWSTKGKRAEIEKQSELENKLD